jgi:hypothetical protein
MLHQVQATRVEPHLSFTFEKNIVYWETGPLLAGPWTKININMDNNCYWSTADQPVTFAKLSLDEWRQQQKHDEHSIIADPMFVDPKHSDFHLRPGSPAETGLRAVRLYAGGRVRGPGLGGESEGSHVSAAGVAAAGPEGRAIDSPHQAMCR